MKIKFCGAAEEVTGSCHLLEINGKKILLDCGMFQGRRKEVEKKNRHFLFDPKEIDAVLLSHAHIDHCGNLPNLVKQGFKGLIYTTYATSDLCYYMLRDSAYIQEQDVEYLNRHREKSEPAVEPLYTLRDAEKVFDYFTRVNYGEFYPIEIGIEACFYDAGHILGSALIFFRIHELQTDRHFTLCFSGDLGRRVMPILRDPCQIKEGDYLITEGTYGNRLHRWVKDADLRLADIVNRTIKRGGKLIIPAFALGRTQDMVYALHLLSDRNLIPKIPIFVDSPLADNVTKVFQAHPECFDQETQDVFIKHRENPFGFEDLIYVNEVEDSKKLNVRKEPCIIISASGMCEYGRILHHLKNNIEDPRNTVLLVGFMAEHTLGRKLLEKQPVVNIFGQPYKVNCEVKVMDAFSAHADRKDLLNYVTQIKGIKKTFLVHGEKDALSSLEQGLEESGFKDIVIPKLGEEVEI